MKFYENLFKSSHGTVIYITEWVGDYHAPRLLALHKALEAQEVPFLVLQLGTKSKLYSHTQKRRETLIKKFNFLSDKCDGLLNKIFGSFVYLYRIRPRYILVLGYNNPISIAAVIYSKIFRAKIFFFSDSKADDHYRSTHKEIIKKIILKLFDGALVAGKKHQQYFKSLGFDKPIEMPYDVIDNDYFFSRAARYQNHKNMIRKKLLPERYIICVSRLVPRKRIELALRLYNQSGIFAEGFAFVLIGDGPSRREIEELVESLNLRDVFFHFLNVPNHQMPGLYVRASALVLASEYDQWGLCVNEAMACGVPCFVTPRCGVAGELVTEETGVIFSAETLNEAAASLKNICINTFYREQMSNACLRQVQLFSQDKFADAVTRLVGSP